MTHAQWLGVLATHDRTVLILAGMTLAYIVNWYAWPGARRVMLWLPIIVLPVIQLITLLWR